MIYKNPHWNPQPR